MELLDSKTLRSEGAKAGLVFGTISGGYIFLSQWLSGLGDTGGIINFILELGKIIGLIFLMRHYMIALNTIYDEVDRRQTFRFGVYTALFSALITAACAFIASHTYFPKRFNRRWRPSARCWVPRWTAIRCGLWRRWKTVSPLMPLSPTACGACSMAPCFLSFSRGRCPKGR